MKFPVSRAACDPHPPSSSEAELQLIEMLSFEDLDQPTNQPTNHPLLEAF